MWQALSVVKCSRSLVEKCRLVSPVCNLHYSQPYKRISDARLTFWGRITKQILVFKKEKSNRSF